MHEEGFIITPILQMSKLSPKEVKREKAAEPEPRPHVPWVPALFLPSCHARGTGGRSGPCPFRGQNPASGSCVVSARILLARGPKSLGSRSAHRVPLSTRPLRRLPAAILLPSPRSWCVRGASVRSARRATRFCLSYEADDRERLWNSLRQMQVLGGTVSILPYKHRGC